MRKLLHRLGDYLLQKALAAECRPAGLSSATEQLSFGPLAYLQRPTQAGLGTEAIVMLHGAASDRNAWVRMTRSLKTPLPVLIPDLPGHGASASGLELDYGVAAQAARLRELFVALGIGRVHLIGNSMGGAIALHLAAHAPELVASLVLIDAAGVEAAPSALRQQIERTGRNPMLELQNAADYRAMMQLGMSQPPVIPGFLVSALTRAFIARRALNQKISQDISADLDQTAQLARIRAPSLFIWGMEDKVLHPDNAALLHRQLANSRVLMLEHIGHVAMVEAPGQLGDICSTFLAGHTLLC
jgi:abhydrolase domain-containing protein 6